MKEHEIRAMLLRQLPVGGLVREELGLVSHTLRADVAVLHGEVFHLFEIKSEVDSLKRLPAQAFGFSLLADRCTLVAAPRHIPAALDFLPDWWGVLEAWPTESRLREVRPARDNIHQDSVMLARLLWSEELRAALCGLGVSCSGLRLKERAELLAHVLPQEHLRSLVRRSLRDRKIGGWRWRSVA